MKSFVRILVVSIFWCVVVVPCLQGAAYIKFDGIDGESSDATHRGWSDLVSFQLSIPRADPAAAAPTRPTGEIRLEKLVDKSTPNLMQASVEKAVKRNITIEFTRDFADNRETYLSYELQNVLIVSYHLEGSRNRDAQTETLELTFESMKITYTEFDRDGTRMDTKEYTWRVEEDMMSHSVPQ